MKVLNVVWPAIYIAGGLMKLWYFILITIVVEWIILMFFQKIKPARSLLMSTTGNLISGVAGIYILPWLIFFPEMIVDGILQIGTFHMVSWVISFILMCLGSILIEVVFINLIFRTGFRKLLLPMMIGNVLTYIILGILALNETIKLID